MDGAVILAVLCAYCRQTRDAILWDAEHHVPARLSPCRDNSTGAHYITLGVVDETAMETMVVQE